MAGGPAERPRAGPDPDRQRRIEYRWRVNSLWLIPVLCIAAGCAAAAITLLIDLVIGFDALPGHPLGTAGAVQTILSTAASAMLTLTTVVLTVLTLGVQLAMQQFSPRIVRALLADGRSQLAHGLFAATFLYCMVAVAAVDDTGSPGHQVPNVTVAFGYLLLLASLLVLIGYVHHAGQSLRVAGLVDLVGDNLQREIDRSFPPIDRPVVDPATIAGDEAGVVVMVDVARLVDEAQRTDDCLEMLVAVGDFVPKGAPMVRWRNGRTHDTTTIRRAVVLDNERSHIGDAPYGLRKLVEVAERSIASGPHDDPGTAVQAIDRIHDGMRQLCTRRMPATEHRDAAGELRVVTRELAWHGFVALAFEDIVELGSAAPFVARRLLSALDDLLATAPVDRRPPLEAQRRHLLAGAARNGITVLPDGQGRGSGRDVSASG
ncbi:MULTISPECIES: DUF2254 family protein [unclassified Curtobacterium]|uniref:DUF2254 family protein n=1 Tax=unclassified Curtobacterium TaxID=257496 RepID=UPI0037F44415